MVYESLPPEMATMMRSPVLDEGEVVHGLADVLQERFLQSVEVVHDDS